MLEKEIKCRYYDLKHNSPNMKNDLEEWGSE